MITRREKRYALLRKNGFCKFEAEPLSFIPIKIVPYMKPLIRERWRMLRDALRHGVTITRFEAAIKADYHKDRFTKLNRAGKAVPDPWAMVKDYEDRYRSKTPAYESPWEERRRRAVDFMAKIELTIAKGRRMKAYG